LKLAPRPRSKHEKRTAGSAWETWTVAAADGVCYARVMWDINCLFTFKTAPFFCVCPVLRWWEERRPHPIITSSTATGQNKIYIEMRSTALMLWEFNSLMWRELTPEIRRYKTEFNRTDPLLTTEWRVLLLAVGFTATFCTT
jgi:hypothetical protein